jgi:transposase InsO family protein
MPWKECSAMEERLRFVARLLEGEAMSDLAREFGISRKTGYKIFNRYREHGLQALCDRSRRPWRYANQLPLQLESLIVRAKKERPHWGARKIRELLVRRLAGDVRIPARSTVHAVLDRHGLVKRAKTRRNKAMGTTLADVSLPNALWCADFKGEFRLGNREYCYPLTVTDQASRFILMCEALQSTREEGACTAFQRLFEERGLPDAIRTDNGLPFASPNGLYNLSRLSVWWLRLGIAIERIKPGKPTQNARHERMHLTLKTETTRPPGMNSLQQQARFDDFVREFNHDRPHEALALKAPVRDLSPRHAQLSRPAGDRISPPRPRRPRYSLRSHLHAQEEDQHLDCNGRPKARAERGRRRNLGRNLHGLRPRIYRLGTENTATYRKPVRYPGVTHVLGTICHPCVRVGHSVPWRRRRDSNPRYALTAYNGLAMR